ncbi:hypothetical protein EDC04DRAFT_3138362 [Pisolithus marmoratus]|nr:hypothetical protein EDC04DRAFT_3138362 [Pisolithus marmoratus]
MVKKQAQGDPIPEVKWTEPLTWKLLDEIERNENRIVLLGKRKKGEKSSGDRKITVFKRMGTVILPDLYALDPVACGDRVKRKFEHLTKLYQKFAKRLRTTGEGVRSDDGEGSDESDNEYFDCYVPASGPDETTTERARSIWDEIVQECPFFPMLHRIFSSRPNITPIAVTTGVGPHGKKTVHFQLPSDDEGSGPKLSGDQMSQVRTLQDVLNAEMARRGVSPSFELPEDMGFSEEPSFGGEEEKENSSTPPQPSATPIGKHRPNSSSSGSIDKAKQQISLVPKKRSFEETLLDMQHANLEAINSRARAEMCMQERQMLLKEFEAGIWTREEYKKRLMELSGGPSKKIHLTSENDE